MDLRPIRSKLQYNKLVTHVIQSWEWGDARKSLNIPVLRYGIFKKGRLVKVFQLTLHKIPKTSKYVGYLPKGPLPDKELVEALKKISQKENLAFIKIEPNVEILNSKFQIPNSLIKSPKPLFTKYNFVLDITKSEEDLLKNMYPKTRYNIRVAEKHQVKVEERVDDEAFEIYLKLYFETTKRQGYHGHNKTYHQKIWQALRDAKMARILISFYQEKPLTAWMLLNFKETLFYPYGGSSLEHKEVMANNLVAWEAIKLGKKMKLKYFDMWGALGPNADHKNPWFGFHKFKMGYGGKHVEYLDTYDYVLNWPIYFLFTVIDKLTPLKIFLLKVFGK